MSIEDKIGGLADAMNNLATAMNRYAGVMESIANGNPSQIVGPGAGNDNSDAGDTDDGKTGGKRKRRTKAEIEADAKAEAERLRKEEANNGGGDDIDPFGDDTGGDSEPELTAETIRALVLKVKDKNKDHALALLKKLGVDTLAKIPEKDYPKVVELAAKVGVTLDDIG